MRPLVGLSFCISRSVDLNHVRINGTNFDLAEIGIDKETYIYFEAFNCAGKDN